MKQAARDFLNRKDLRQKVRRELLFGLFPKTLTGLSLKLVLFFTFYPAGQEQKHFVHNALNVLVHEGFLRDQQGVQSLEVVQKVYEIIKKKPRRATQVVKDLESLCGGISGKFTLDYQAVITLVYEDSQTNEKYYHAVRVSK